ncbi:MAG TPA: hypothetical protein VLJ11_14400, partial [Bryobacteraceae bacterium]|nr:hypothetical protein [Bryobacteraceae bacterium]
VGDLYTTLHKRGIRLMVYLPSGAPAHDKAAVAALEWRNGPYKNLDIRLPLRIYPLLSFLNLHRSHK